MTVKFPHFWSHDWHRRPCPKQAGEFTSDYWAQCRYCGLIKTRGVFINESGLIVARSVGPKENTPICAKGPSYQRNEARLRMLLGEGSDTQ